MSTYTPKDYINALALDAKRANSTTINNQPSTPSTAELASPSKRLDSQNYNDIMDIIADTRKKILDVKSDSSPSPSYINVDNKKIPFNATTPVKRVDYIPTVNDNKPPQERSISPRARAILNGEYSKVSDLYDSLPKSSAAAQVVAPGSYLTPIKEQPVKASHNVEPIKTSSVTPARDYRQLSSPIDTFVPRGRNYSPQARAILDSDYSKVEDVSHLRPIEHVLRSPVRAEALQPHLAVDRSVYQYVDYVHPEPHREITREVTYGEPRELTELRQVRYVDEPLAEARYIDEPIRYADGPIRVVDEHPVRSYYPEHSSVYESVYVPSTSAGLSERAKEILGSSYVYSEPVRYVDRPLDNMSRTIDHMNDLTSGMRQKYARINELIDSPQVIHHAPVYHTPIQQYPVQTVQAAPVKKAAAPVETKPLRRAAPMRVTTTPTDDHYAIKVFIVAMIVLFVALLIAQAAGLDDTLYGLK